MFKGKIACLVILVITVFPLIFKPYRDFLYKISADFFYPFFSFSTKIQNSIWEKKDFSQNSKGDLISQISKMKKTIIELEGTCKYLQSFRDENRELRQLLNIRPVSNYKYRIAEVLYRDPANWYEQFTIAKGTDAGIENGAIVIGVVNNSDKEKVRFGVIGRIGAVSKHTAVVYTLLSNECQLSVAVPASGATGVLHGGGRHCQRIWANIFFLPKDIKYIEGSLVLTSGLTPLAPKGLTIGKLVNINNKDDDDKLFAKMEVEPAIDLAHLLFVLVLGKIND